METLIKAFIICASLVKAPCTSTGSVYNTNEDQGSCPAGEIWGEADYSSNMAANTWMTNVATACKTWCESITGCV